MTNYFLSLISCYLIYFCVVEFAKNLLSVFGVLFFFFYCDVSVAKKKCR